MHAEMPLHPKDKQRIVDRKDECAFNRYYPRHHLGAEIALQT